MRTLLTLFLMALLLVSFGIINQETNVKANPSNTSTTIESSLETDSSREDIELARKRPGRCCMG